MLVCKVLTNGDSIGKRLPLYLMFDEEIKIETHLL